jgi:hypothetical protein
LKLSELDSCGYSREGFPPHVKSPIIWGHKGNVEFPLCYLTRPKSVSLEDWNDFLDGFSFTLKKGI